MGTIIKLIQRIEWAANKSFVQNKKPSERKMKKKTKFTLREVIEKFKLISCID